MIFKLPKENGVHYFSGLNQVAEGLLFLDIFKKIIGLFILLMMRKAQKKL